MRKKETKNANERREARNAARRMALRVLGARHPEEYREIYIEILDKEFGLKPGGQMETNYSKYV